MTVPLDPRLLELLRCPVCRRAVRPTADGAALACDGCGRLYPVVDGIPVMIAEDAGGPGR
jgi:uncharacterized protein